MLGLLEPTEGRIEIGGVPLARLGLARWRAAAAGVIQDDVLFAGSIAADARHRRAPSRDGRERRSRDPPRPLRDVTQAGAEAS